MVPHLQACSVVCRVCLHEVQKKINKKFQLHPPTYPCNTRQISLIAPATSGFFSHVTPRRNLQSWANKQGAQGAQGWPEVDGLDWTGLGRLNPHLILRRPDRALCRGLVCKMSSFLEWPRRGLDVSAGWLVGLAWACVSVYSVVLYSTVPQRCKAGRRKMARDVWIARRT